MSIVQDLQFINEIIKEFKNQAAQNDQNELKNNKYGLDFKSSPLIQEILKFKTLEI